MVFITLPMMQLYDYFFHNVTYVITVPMMQLMRILFQLWGLLKLHARIDKILQTKPHITQFWNNIEV